jgi:hypothetical protein
MSKNNYKFGALASVCLAIFLQGCQSRANHAPQVQSPYPQSLTGSWKMATTEDSREQQDQAGQFQTPSASHPAVQKSQMFAVEMIDDHHNLTGTGQDQKGGFVFTGVFNSPEISMVKINNKTGERITFDGRLSPGADPPYATGRWQSTTAKKETASGNWQANFFPSAK